MVKPDGMSDLVNYYLSLEGRICENLGENMRFVTVKENLREYVRLLSRSFLSLLMVTHENL